jgi:hypothetical protein
MTNLSYISNEISVLYIFGYKLTIGKEIREKDGNSKNKTSDKRN